MVLWCVTRTLAVCSGTISTDTLTLAVFNIELD